MTNLSNLSRNIRPLQLFSVSICGLANSFFIKEETIPYFFVPGVSFAFALLLPEWKNIPDRRFSLFFFPMSLAILWWLVLILGFMFVGPLLEMSPLFAFPFIGSFGGWLTYLLYGKLVLARRTLIDEIVCAILGYISFLLYVIINKGVIGQNFLQGIFIYWQPLVGFGCSIGDVRNNSKASFKPSR